MTIGFNAAAYRVTETDSIISRPVSVSVQSGSLARDVVVTVQTMNGSATGGRSSDYTMPHTYMYMYIAYLSVYYPTLCISLKFNRSNGHARQLVLFYCRLRNFRWLHRMTKLKCAKN